MCEFMLISVPYLAAFSADISPLERYRVKPIYVTNTAAIHKGVSEAGKSDEQEQRTARDGMYIHLVYISYIPVLIQYIHYIYV